MSLYNELKRRNVIRLAIAYVAISWLLIQVVETLFPIYGLSDAAIRVVVATVAIGFIPAMVIAWVFEFTPEGIKRDVEVDHNDPGTRGAGKKLDRIILVILALGFGYLAFDKFVLDPARDVEMLEQATQQARTETLLESFGDKSIAVLAFADMSPEGDQEYFSDGIAEELLNLLAAIDELRVISRSTAFTFKGSGYTLKEIAKKLDVTYILEGSVRKSGNMVRITAQLINARVDTHLWSRTYDRPFDDIFAIQDEISALVVDELKLTLLGDMPQARRINPEAYDLFLQARYIVHSEKQDQIEEAELLLNQALEIDPAYIEALAELPRVYYRLQNTDARVPPEVFEDRVRDISNRIVTIDPNSTLALFSQGWVLWKFDNDIQGGFNYLEQAMRSNPDSVDVLRVVVLMLNMLDRTDEAIALSNHLIIRDPNCAACVNNLVFAYRRAGRYQEAVQALEALLVWRPPGDAFYWGLGVAWLGAGHPGNALSAFEKIEITGLRELASILALHDLGRTDEFEARFAALRDYENPHYESVARVYAWIGDNDNAFKWIDRMIESEGHESVGLIDTDLYQKIKTDPRWDAMREKYGLVNLYENIEFEITLPAGVKID